MDRLIFYPNINFDYSYLTQLVHTSKPIVGRPNHHRLVADDSYMTTIRNKYNFLSPIYNVYVLPDGLPVHIDAGRKCTLNIPLVNCEETVTIVYQPIESDTIRETDRVLDRFLSTDNLVEIYRFELTKPTLFNTTFPHEVVSNGKNRISISWSVNVDISFEEAVNLFSGCEQD